MTGGVVVGEEPDGPLGARQWSWLKLGVQGAELVTPLITLTGVVWLLWILARLGQWSEFAAAVVAFFPLVVGGLLLGGAYHITGRLRNRPRFAVDDGRKLGEAFLKLYVVITVGVVLGIVVTTAHLPVAQSGVMFWVSTVVGVAAWMLAAEMVSVYLLGRRSQPASPLTRREQDAG